MSNQLTIPQGTKLQIAYDVPMGDNPNFNMLCTFVRAIDESAFLISIPMNNGASLPLDENQKFLIRYSRGSEVQILAAFADDIIREGIRRFWKMRRVTEVRQFCERKHERLSVALRMEYSQPTWPINDQGLITPEDAMSLDISAGGLALFLNRRFDVGEIIEVSLPRIGITPEGAAIKGIMSTVCWCREAPKGSLFRFIVGLQFRMGEDTQRDQIANYVSCLKKVYKL